MIILYNMQCIQYYNDNINLHYIYVATIVYKLLYNFIIYYSASLQGLLSLGLAIVRDVCELSVISPP